MNKRVFTSESVTEGHPDKVCDRISDSVLDAMLAQDKFSRVACETCCSTGLVLVVGEITSNAKNVDVEKIVRDAIADIGYTKKEYGFDNKTCEVIVRLDKQSSDIALGVDNSVEEKNGGDHYDQIGAGDQGMVFGCATNETPNYMPMPIYLAHKLTRQLTKVRKDGTLDYLRPDGKAQVTVEYIDEKPAHINAVVVSTQHNPDVDIEQLRSDIKKYVIGVALPKELLDENTKYYINPTGRFVIGGPAGDSGVTGRKIIVDTYGGYCTHGGGAFSGKDPTKVDRSACYMARYICKNLVASGLVDRCQLDISYAIGVAHPVSIQLNTFGTGKTSDETLNKIIAKVFDMRPSAIIEKLNLRDVKYVDTCNYGHFGKEEMPWEKTNKVEDILKEYELIK
ncbi:MAG: methionine adenosyltransferase [Clostridia bacterium]